MKKIKLKLVLQENDKVAVNGNEILIETDSTRITIFKDSNGEKRSYLAKDTAKGGLIVV